MKFALPTPRDAVIHTMETFPIVKKEELESFGTYRTKDTILEIHNAMTTATRIVGPYYTRLSPLPADPLTRRSVYQPTAATMPIK